MTLPFTHDQFLDVFGAYNRSLGVFALALWLLTVAVLTVAYRRGGRASRAMAVLVGIHWIWSGVAYHFVFFRAINPTATLFGVVFVIEGLLFLWRGAVRGGDLFVPVRSLWGAIGTALISYALAYPGLGLTFGLRYPRWPSFGVPCPTTILTVGALLCAPRREARLLGVIPLLWTAVGGSAAWLLDIRADFALPVSGVLLLVYLLLPTNADHRPTTAAGA